MVEVVGCIGYLSLWRQTLHAGVTKVREMWGLHGIAQTLDEDESK
ncbi:hypothetical protein HMPREF1991_00813 [Hoylesella loescheii DSM 19665 = JCM 12249 = ATCC 15930]|uniref:Uncharacterized protein n=1 Tax=Hoylesella loescheii DSM 19665 = JCM 12249 = ATCC 15930 TaxID=1122985 RepID=A0A069QK88_HOYLO|nr:hypothetical protein HMPREF1991_00813 [Hoylesella loescheii DSM 19665 = JCM 12249 = ATCC 15930]